MSEEDSGESAKDSAAVTAGLVGVITAAVTSCLFCWPPSALTMSTIELFVRSAVDMIVVACAGALGGSLISILQSATRSKRSQLYVSNMIATCLLFPSATLLYRQRSLWAVGVIALAAAIIAAATFRLLYDDLKPNDNEFRVQQTLSLSPFSEHDRIFEGRSTIFIALGLQASVIFVITGVFVAACISAAISACCLSWRLSFSRLELTEGSTGATNIWRRLLALCMLALVFTFFSLAPYLKDPGLSKRWMAIIDRNPTIGTHIKVNHLFGKESTSSYVGVVLWPPRKDEKRLKPPIFDHISSGQRFITKPIEIAFDGPYWYFKSPDKHPTKKAHVAYGRPTQKNIHSSDWTPLQMEAHQNLPFSIDVRCCREIDVHITNADTRAGTVHLGLVLTDSRSTPATSLSLGEHLIVSTNESVSIHRPPIVEVLRFAIPRSTRLQRFDAITVKFLPSKERNLGAPQISVEKFTFIPG